MASADTALTQLVKNVTINYQTRLNLFFNIRNFAKTANSANCNLGTATETGDSGGLTITAGTVGTE